MTTPQENAATCREFIQRVLNEGDISYAEKMLADDFVDHSPMPGTAGDKASAIAMFTMMRAQTPDMHIEVEDVVADGSKVAVRSTMTGTDTNGFMPGMPPTGKAFSMGGMDVLTFDENGLNTEHYGIYDIPGAMTQLGLMPPPGG